MLRYYSHISDVIVDNVVFPYQVLQLIENNELTRQGAPKLAIQVTSAEINEAIFDFLGTSPSDKNSAEIYNHWLSQIGLSEEQHKDIVEADLLHGKLINYFIHNKVPTEAEQINLHVMGFNDVNVANEVINRLNEGENFSVLAAKYSILNEESMGWVPRGIYPELDEVAFGLDLGKISDVIEMNQIYYIIMVSERASSMSINTSQRRILASREYDTWLMNERRKSIIVEYLTQYQMAWAVGQI